MFGSRLMAQPPIIPMLAALEKVTRTPCSVEPLGTWHLAALAAREQLDVSGANRNRK